MPLTRRKSLRIGGIALVVSLSGCLFKHDPPETRVGEISVLNKQDSSKKINVLIMEDSDPVYWNSVEVESFNEDENRLGGGELNDIPDSPGHYVLYVWENGQPRIEWEKQNLSEFDSSCVSVLVLIGDGAEDSQENINIRMSTNCPGGSA